MRHVFYWLLGAVLVPAALAALAALLFGVVFFYLPYFVGRDSWRKWNRADWLVATGGTGSSAS